MHPLCYPGLLMNDNRLAAWEYPLVAHGFRVIVGKWFALPPVARIGTCRGLKPLSGPSWATPSEGRYWGFYAAWFVLPQFSGIHP